VFFVKVITRGVHLKVFSDYCLLLLMPSVTPAGHEYAENTDNYCHLLYLHIYIYKPAVINKTSIAHTDLYFISPSQLGGFINMGFRLACAIYTQENIKR
jgi:hypothetical protein